MDLLWHINLEEMLGGLTVTTFLILLATSVVVVSSMVLFPLIDLAFERKVKPTIEDPRHHDDLTVSTSQTGRPWFALRSDFLRPDAVPHSQQMSDLERRLQMSDLERRRSRSTIRTGKRAA
jgi:hypothetical protein